MPFDFVSHRSPVLARHGMVATSQPLATIAGVKVLMKGATPRIRRLPSPRASM